MRKTQSHTVAGNILAFQNATKEIQPPASLSDNELPLFKIIVAAKAIEEWTLIQLQHAVIYARTLNELETYQRQLDKEGVITSDGKIHPLFNVIDTLTKRSIQCAKFLQLHARGQNGERRDLEAKRKSETLAVDTWELLATQSLLNTPED